VLEIQQCNPKTRFGFQHFRCQTLLIFHNPVTERAFGDSPKANQRAKRAGRAKPAAKRAARSVSAPLAFSRDCVKFGSAKFALA
jgi:hypothetical protein